MQNNTVSLATLAKLLNLSERRIQQLARKGIIPRVKSGQYDVIGGIQGYLKYLQPEHEDKDQTSYQQQKTRLIQLQADLLELRLARKNRQLISVKAVDDAWMDITIRAKDILLNMVPGLTAKIVLLKDSDAITDCIDQEVENVLELLAKPDYHDDFHEEPAETDDELDREIEEILADETD